MKHTITVMIIFLFSNFLFLTGPTPVLADADGLLWGGYSANFQARTGLGDRDPREIIANLIRVLLGFLGILAVMIITLAGFKWMISAGDEEKVAVAKGMISSGAIGLIIVMFSFGLSQFIISSLFRATGAVG